MEEFGGSHGFHGELRSRGGGGAIEFKGGSLRKLTANEGWGWEIYHKDITELYHRETSKILQTPTPSRRNKVTSPVRVDVIGILF